MNTITGINAPLQSIAAYPNPFPNHFVLENVPAESEIVVTDMQGTVLLKRSDSERVEIGEGLSNGVYFVSIKSGKDIQMLKVVKC